MARITGKPKTRLRDVQEGMKARDIPAPAPASAWQTETQQPQHQPAGKRQGRNTEIGHLAQLFQQYARADGIELRKGYPVICTEINDLVTRWHLREKHFEQYADACQRRHLPDTDASKCWYHTRDEVRHRAITWVEMVEVIMAEFWSRVWDEHALDYFRQYFAEYGRAAVKHWASLSAIEAINARPHQPRDIMRRRTFGATMPSVSKEGE